MVSALTAFLLAVVAQSAAYAAPPGTVISNQARLDYQNSANVASTEFSNVVDVVTAVTRSAASIELTRIRGLGQGDYQETVKRALRYLKAVQDNDGCFDTTNREDPHFVYGHSICTMAMAEAFGMTGSNMLRGPAQKGVDFIATAQNHDPDRGYLGWRYGVKPGDSDTSVTGWMLFVLASAKDAGLDVDQEAIDGGMSWIDEVTDPKSGLVGYDGPNTQSSRTPANQAWPREKGEAMTAVAPSSRAVSETAFQVAPLNSTFPWEPASAKAARAVTSFPTNSFMASSPETESRE